MPKRSRGRSRTRSRTRAAAGTIVAMARRAIKSRGPRASRVRAKGVHSFSRYCTAVTPIEMNSPFKAGEVKTSFNQLVQHTDFTALFDQYRINKVTMTVQMINNPDSAAYLNPTQSSWYNNTTNWYPKLWYIFDADGGADETIASIKERQGVKCRILQPNKTIKISWRPQCRVLTYSTSTSTGYSPKNIKIDMTDTNVEHFGLKYVFDGNQENPVDTAPFKFAIETKLHFTCYGVR